MNEIQVKVDFTKRTIQLKGVNLTEGDFKSTKMVFEFDRDTGTKMLEMNNPSGELVYSDVILNNEVVLVGKAPVTKVESDTTYYKYEKNSSTYWYDPENDKLYDNTMTEVSTFDLDEYTQEFKDASLFTEEGKYPFEISLYENGGKLSSASASLKVLPEQVVVDGEVVDGYVPLFETYIITLDTKINECDNLNITASKSGNTTTISLTDKTGTTTTTEILDGTSLEDIEIDNGDLKVTYGGTTDDLGQIVPNIQIGTTTTGSPTAPASVVNVGTELNPILNFTIPKGEPGAIHMIIVDTPPTEDIDESAIYLVPITPDISGNNYAEYIYVNGQWELLGKIGVSVTIDSITNQEIDAMWS